MKHFHNDLQRLKTAGPQTLSFSILLLSFLVTVSPVWGTCPLSAPVISSTDASSCKITINWEGDANADHYNVKYKIKGQSSWLNNVNVGLSTSFSVINLTGNTKYIFTVIPYCSNGEKGISAKKTITTTPCSRPENLIVSNIDNNSATVSWALCGTGSEAFIRIRQQGFDTWTILSAGQQTFLNIPGLNPQTKYQYQVNTCDTANKSLWTAKDNFTTLAVPAWKPNVLLIYLDDCRYDAFGPTGGPAFFHSPAINSIAEEGANFRWCFPALSLCSPSRASIVSGLYPHHHGVYCNALVDTFAHTTLAEIMQENNYYTGFVGKYSFEKFPIPGYDYYCQSTSDEYWDTKYQYNNPDFTTIPGHKTDIFTWKALEFLSEVPGGKKFMLFLAHKAPHEPYDSRIEDEGIFDNDTMPFPLNYSKYLKNIPSHYYNCNQAYPTPDKITPDYKKYFELINGAEWSVDTILNYLKSKNLLDSTLIIFTSDNGYLIGEHNMGGKELSLEPSIRLPMFIRYPKWFSSNTVIDKAMAMNIDIAPTILDAAGIPDTFDMDGVSMRALANGTVHRKQLFYEFFYRKNCNPTFQAVRDFEYKYVNNQCSSFSEEFYDLVNDPLEKYNLINDPTYSPLVTLYQIKMDSLKNYYGYVNISDTTLNCSLLNKDSSVIQFRLNPGNANGNTIQLYPNPGHDQINFSYSCKLEGQALMHLSVFNIFSQPVLKKDIPLINGNNSYTIDISGFAPGIYIGVFNLNGKQESLILEKL